MKAIDLVHSFHIPGGAMETTNPIQEWLNTPIPKKLWHYTSVEGFYGITTGRDIYATDFRFLNDREEFIHARKIIEELVEGTPEDANGIKVRRTLQSVINAAFSPSTGIIHPDHTHFYVASFSAAEDQLSQWRGYSHGSSGVSLCLDLNSFRGPSNVGGLVSFAPCAYDPLKKRELIHHALGHSLISNSSQLDRNQVVDAVAKTVFDLQRILALLKNSAFHEEQEWRLVFSVSASNETKLNLRLFRAANTTLVPYVRYSFSSNPDTPIPLNDLILGPSSDEHAIFAAKSFLETQGIKITPRPSNVPYRPS